jgi:ribosome biogenesis protein UTP30
MLPKALGKTFYKSTAKRPIPVSISTPTPRTDGKKIARAKGEEKSTAGTPQAIATEIEKALSSALVHLSPSASTSVRVGYANMKPEELAANVEAVANGMIEKLVTKQWRNVKSIHIKGQNTTALPIWLADELWVEEQDVLDEETAQRLKGEQANVGKKRKILDAPAPVEEEEEGTDKKTKKNKKQKLIESNDDNLDNEIKARKDSLRKLKAEAKKAGEEADAGEKVVAKSVKKGKKAKSAA